MESKLNEIVALANTIIAEPYFLVSARVKPTNNYKLFVDGDQGITIETCVKINRQLYKLIDEREWYPEGDFSLELSSPGVDEPLILHRQYIKNIGRKVEVTFNDESKKIGNLLLVTEQEITIEELVGKGKKAEIVNVLIPLENIKSTIVQVSF